MTREKLKLVSGVPLVIELENLGTESTSRFHDDIEYLYLCQYRGESAMLYLKVDGHLAVKRSGAGVGDEIEIVKKLTNGAPVFSVRRFSDAQLAVEAEPVKTVTMLAPQAQRVSVPSRQIAPAAAPIATVHPLEEMMTRCLEVGYRANITAYNNLRAQGVDIDAPTWEDVRSTGTSFFIQRMKDGGAR